MSPSEAVPAGGWEAFKARLLKTIEEAMGEGIDGPNGERTGAYIRMPPFNLICAKCGKVCRPIAHNTGDGWLLTLDCDCQEIDGAAYFDWPKAVTNFTGKELEALGFDIV
ncbi:MAG: hypothetical protein KAJ19_09930 [Gammaproteobacteria bacterium]|nr:hypothetical protein [Gammaproteobacteria bacterium]